VQRLVEASPRASSAPTLELADVSDDPEDLTELCEQALEAGETLVQFCTGSELATLTTLVATGPRHRARTLPRALPRRPRRRQLDIAWRSVLQMTSLASLMTLPPFSERY
jgi:hypothetical protein